MLPASSSRLSPSENAQRSRLDVFARVAAKEGGETALARVLIEHLPDVRRTQGCAIAHDYGSIRDPRLLYIHSRWDELDAFERYATLASTGQFVHEAEGYMESPPLRAIRTVIVEGDEAAALPEGELYVFAPFHARAGRKLEAEQALSLVHTSTEQEPGCLMHRVCRSTRDAALFYVHSVWSTPTSFEQHVALAHTQRFVEEIVPLLDHPLEVTRTRRIG